MHEKTIGIGSRIRGMFLTPVLCLAALLPSAGGEQPGPGAESANRPVSQRVLDELRAAGRARRARLEEEEARRAEQQRLKLLVSTVRDKAARYRSAAAADRKRIAEREKRGRELAALRDRRGAIENMVGAIAARLQKTLNEVADASLPGLVPPATDTGSDPAGKFAAAISRLRGSRRRGTGAAVELVAGRLGGRTVTVKLLRAGGAAAWWVALDGEKAGTARVEDGRLILRPVGPAEADSIRKTLAVLEARAAPELLLLPAGDVTADRPAEAK